MAAASGPPWAPRCPWAPAARASAARAVRGPDGHRVEACQVLGWAVAAVLGPLLAVHHPLNQVRLQGAELVPLVRGHDVVFLVLDEVGDHLRGRACHRLRVLVGQSPGYRVPGEDVGDYEAVLLGAPCVLGEIDQVCLQAVVGPSAVFPRLRGFEASTCLATSPLRPRPVHRDGRSENSRFAIWYSFQASLTLKSLASRRSRSSAASSAIFRGFGFALGLDFSSASTRACSRLQTPQRTAVSLP